MSNSTIQFGEVSDFEFIKAQESVDFLTKEKRISLGLDFMSVVEQQDQLKQDQLDSFPSTKLDSFPSTKLDSFPSTKLDSFPSTLNGLEYKNNYETVDYENTIHQDFRSPNHQQNHHDNHHYHDNHHHDNHHESRRVSNPLTEEQEDKLISRICSFENGFAIMLAKCKESIQNSKKVLHFLQKRCAYETEYSASVAKAFKLPAAIFPTLHSTNPPSKSGKSSWDRQWDMFTDLHQKQGQLHADFANNLKDMAENVQGTKLIR